MIPWMMIWACTGPSPDSGALDSGSPQAEPCGEGAEVGLEVGQCAPEFTLPDQSGESFSLSSLRGKVALVDISAVW